MNATSGMPTSGRALRLVRWTVTSGSSTQSRGAVVLRAAGHRWEAAAEGNGPIDALFNAVDRAIAEILAGHPRLLAYDIHARAEGPDAEGEVRVEIGPPAEAAGDRAAGTFSGVARSTNIVAASIEAYIQAINALGGTPIGLVGDMVMRDARNLDDAESILRRHRPINGNIHHWKISKRLCNGLHKNWGEC